MDPEAPISQRLVWVDQLRSLCIVQVVVMHACVTYGHVGSWYLKEGPELPLVDTLFFAFYQAHLQSFFMGVLFFAAGHFAHRSLLRQGAAGFARRRLARLGLPTLAYALFLHPLIVIGMLSGRHGLGDAARAYLSYVASGELFSGTGPMWFALALMAFSAGLCAVPETALRPVARPVPGAKAVALLCACLAVATYLVRIVEPLGRSVLNMQLCFFPQYVAAFALGVASARGGWMQAMALSRCARNAGLAALILGPFGLAAALWVGGILKGAGMAGIAGGGTAGSLAFAAWEQLTGVGLALGALSFCSRFLNRPTALSAWLARRSFGLYLLHAPLLVLGTLALRPLGLNPYFGVAALSTLGLGAGLLASEALSRIPFIGSSSL